MIQFNGIHGEEETVVKYIKREVHIQETEIELAPEDVMTIAQVAKYLGVYPQAVSLALDRGDLTWIVDRDAPKRQGRRLVLCSEVEAWKERRENRQSRRQNTRVEYTW